MSDPTFSFDSQPYAVTEDPDQLQVVRIPSRLALIQRMTVEGGPTDLDWPDRLRVLVRSEGDRPPGTVLRVRVTDTASVDLVQPRLIDPSVLEFPRKWQWVEVPLVQTVGFGAGPDVEVLVWFQAVQRGLGWEVSTPSTGERVRRWRGPVAPTEAGNPVFGRLLSYPVGTPGLVRLAGTQLQPQIGNAGAIDVSGANLFVSSAAGNDGFRDFVSRGFTFPLGNLSVLEATNHIYLGTRSTSASPANIRKVRKSDIGSVGALAVSNPRASTFVAGVRGPGTLADFGFFVTFTPGRVYKIRLNDGVGNTDPPAFQNANSLSGNPTMTAIARDNSHVYVGTGEFPARIGKFNMQNITTQPVTVTLSAGAAGPEGDYIYSLAVSPDETRLYAVTLNRLVIEYDITGATPVRTRTRSLGASVQTLNTVAVTPDGQSLLVGTSDGRLLRLDTDPAASPPFPTTGSADVGGPLVLKVEVDSAGVAAYVLTWFEDITLNRVLVNDPNFFMPVVGSFELPPSNNLTFDFTANDQTAYLPNSNNDSPRIAKVEIAGAVVSRVNQLSLAHNVVSTIPYFDAENTMAVLREQADSRTVLLAESPVPRLTRYNDDGTREHGVDLPDPPVTFVADASNMFTLMNVGAGDPAVRKHNRSTLATVADLALATGENNPASMTATANHLYIGTATTPGRVVKVAKGAQPTDNMTRLGAVTLNTNENTLTAAANDGTYAYFVTSQIPAKVIKVNMNDGTSAAPTRVGAITLQTGEGRGVAATITPAAGTDPAYLYVLTDSSPAQVIQIDLSEFERVTSVTLAANETFGKGLVSNNGRVYALTNPFVSRVVRLGEVLQATGQAHAIQINTREDLRLNAQTIRRDADVAVQLGVTPEPVTDPTATQVNPVGDEPCVAGVQISWGLPDSECSTVQAGGFVEVERRINGGRWVPVFRVENDTTRTVTDVEMARNQVNGYRLRLVNDAGFASPWVQTTDVEVVSECCGYQFATNLLPNRTLWFDDIGERFYQFPEQVSFIEFEGVDGSVPLRRDSDQLDEFDVSLMVAGFGVVGGTADTAELDRVGRRLFSPLLVLVGNERDSNGMLYRPPHVTVADSEGRVWVAHVDARTGSRTARAGRFVLDVNVKEITRDPEPVVISGEPGSFMQEGDGDQTGLGGVAPIEVPVELSDPDGLLGS